MAAKLSLNARKNIKANDEKTNAHLEAIKEACDLSCDVTMEAQMLEINNWAEGGGYKDRCGDVVEWVMGGLAGNMKKAFATDDIAKTAIQGKWTTGVIKVEMGTKGKNDKGNHKVDFENGDLVVTCFSPASNVSYVGNDIVEKLQDDSGLSVKGAQDVEKYKEDREETCEKIKEMTGLSCDVTVECDWASWFETMDKAGYKDRGGEVLKWYMDGLMGNIKKLFNDDISKNAIQAVWTTGVMKFSGREKGKKDKANYELTFDNGDLVIVGFNCSNLSYVGNAMLDDMTDPETTFSVKSAQNIAKYKEDREEVCENIKEYLGLSCDVTIECDWASWIEIMDKAGYKDRCGEVLKWYTDALFSQFKSLFQDDISKNALHAVWTTGVMKFSAREKGKKDKSNNETTYDNGDLVIVGFNCSNVSYLGKEMLDTLIDPETQLPVKSAMEWMKHEEKRTETLEAIKEAVGLSSDVTLEFEKLDFDGHIAAAGYANRPGDVMQWIIDGLKGNMVKICKEEMTQEAIQEEWTTGIISLVAGDEKQKGNHICTFDNGNLVITYKPKSIASNVSYCGNDIEKLL